MVEAATAGGVAGGVAVVGAGPIGLAVAWRCAQRGLAVSVYDPQPGSGASHAAAGMLAPVAEASFGEQDLTELLVRSAARWPSFASELAGLTGLDLGYRTEGTLVVALTADDLAEVDRLRTYQAGLGLPISVLRRAALREREPLLAPGVRGGAYAPGDHQVDPRRLVDALRAACLAAGVRLVPERVPALSWLTSAGRQPPGTIVVAAGCGSATLAGLPVRPVKGQTLRLRPPGGHPPGFRHVIRGYADSRQVYLVPRETGEVVVGATVEERTDPAVTAGAVLELLRAAVDLVPEVAEYELVEACARHRPGTPDNAPILGWLPGSFRQTMPLAQHVGARAATQGHRRGDLPLGSHPEPPGGAGSPPVLVATGHYRHGIVLAPLTAEVIAAAAAGQPLPPELAPFAPTRFTHADQGQEHAVRSSNACMCP